MKGDLSYIQKAELMSKQFELEELLLKQHEERSDFIVKTIINIQKDFDKLCLNLARADGTMSFKELQALNIYEFYLVKQNVMDNVGRSKPKGSGAEQE